MKHTDLIEAVVKSSDSSRKRVQAVFDRYCTEQLNDPNGLWIETRMRLNNTRHIAFRPGAVQ